MYLASITNLTFYVNLVINLDTRVKEHNLGPKLNHNYDVTTSTGNIQVSVKVNICHINTVLLVAMCMGKKYVPIMIYYVKYVPS